jgi:biopolymer transport protein ExbD
MADMGEGGGGSHDKKGKKKGKKGAPRVDMTPMVDLGFLLITFFMLTTTMSKPQAMELNMPDKTEDKNPQEQQVKASHSMTIILGKNDKVMYFSGVTPKEAKEQDAVKVTDFSASGIRKVILDETKRMGYNFEKKYPNIVIVIKAMDEAKYKNMVDILDEMHITDSKRYAIVDITPEEIDLTKKFDSL